MGEQRGQLITHDVSNGDECSREIQAVLKKYDCMFEVIMVYSSMNPPQFIIKTIPNKQIQVAHNIPNLKGN